MDISIPTLEKQEKCFFILLLLAMGDFFMRKIAIALAPRRPNKTPGKR